VNVDFYCLKKGGKEKECHKTHKGMLITHSPKRRQKQMFTTFTKVKHREKINQKWRNK